jgi:hypothetical protein
MTAIPVAIRVSRQRWLQLTLGIVCMAMIANLGGESDERRGILDWNV